MSEEQKARIRVTHRFTASPERVFDALLDPEKASRYFFTTTSAELVRADIDARVGGSFALVDRRDGEDVEHVGTYLEIDRPRRLVFTLSVPKYSPDADRVTIEIVPQGTGCELTLTQEQLQPVERAKQVAEGWTEILEKLEGVLG
jgi:uncharacterized protein YndB with AHSA1/START domain